MKQIEAVDQGSLLTESGRKAPDSVEKLFKEFVNGAVIKQRYEWMEELITCEYPNIYYVYGRDENGKKSYVSDLKFKDKSDYCDRLGSYNCKKYRMKAYFQKKNEKTDKFEQGTQAMECHRECACNFMCCCKHQMRVNLTLKNKTTF